MQLNVHISIFAFFVSSRRRHTRWPRDWSSDVCSSDLEPVVAVLPVDPAVPAAEEAAVAAGVDGAGRSGLEGERVLIRMDGVAGRTLVREVPPRPDAGGEVAAMDLDRAAVDLARAVRQDGEVPVV